jgi:Ca2+-binding EF-hand superfamily protein
MSTRIWSLAGKEIGMLTMSDLDKEKILQGRLKKTPWIFRPDVEYHIEHGERTAVNLIDAMGTRKQNQLLKKQKEMKRKETLLASKLALQKEMAAEFGSSLTGSNAPANPLRTGLDGLQKIEIPEEKRLLFNSMLGRVASLTRKKKNPTTLGEGNGGEKNSGHSGTDGDDGKEQPETKDDVVSVPRPDALPALRPYEHYDYEMAKVKNKSAAVLEVPVDTTPSPFMRRHMPRNWQQTTAAERLDKKNKALADQVTDRKKSLVPAASAPVLRKADSKEGGDNGLHLSLPALGGAGGAVVGIGKDKNDGTEGNTIALLETSTTNNTTTDTARARKMQALRNRMNAKVKAFENIIEQVEQDEHRDDELEQARVARQPKERKSLYANYDDIDFSDDDNEENIHQSKRAGHNDGKITNFGSYGIKEVLELRKLFNSIDEDASGSIDVEEFVNSPALKSTHLFDNAASMFSSIDRDESGTISFAELLTVAFPQASRTNRKKMLKFVKEHESQEHMKEKISLNTDQLDEINEIFKMYDVDASGGISTEELYDAMVGANPAMQEIFSLEDMDKLVRQYDDDGNSTLELEEFTKLFKENFMEDTAQDAQNTRDKSKRSGARSSK